MNSVDSQIGFQRQRRNLVGVSLFLLLAQMAEIEIRSDFEIFGAGITVGQPSVIWAFVWLAWVYWFWRYVSYQRQVAPRPLRSEFETVLNDYRAAEGIKRAEQEELENPTNTRLERTSFLHWRLRFDSHTRKAGGDRNKTETTVDIKGWSAFWLRTRAAICVVFDKPVFSEFSLPYLIGISPLVVLTYEKFPSL